MPSVIINSSNVDTFSFDCIFDIYNRAVRFDTSASTYNNISGSGILYVQGISFELIDGEGVQLTTIDFSDPTKYIVPSVSEVFTLDLSSVPFSFLFNTYSIRGAIKDQNGAIYYTTIVYKKVCEPVNFNESGYVPGLFQVTADCINNNITVQELTNFSYNNQLPESKTKEGTFYYPTGTISPISFSNTPWSNNVVYTGENRVVNTTVATYNLGDGVFVEINYVTDNAFPITCSNKMSSIMCCIINLQTQYNKNCNNAVGLNAKQKLDSVIMPVLAGLMKEISGQDASIEADLIRKTLNCNCGEKTIKQNEATPINPSVYNIVLNGVGGTSIPSATITGNTKTYNIASSIYQVVKGDTGDLAYTITIDTATANTVKYKLTFNYETIAQNVLNEIEDSPALSAQLNSLIQNSGLNLSGLDGKCIIDLSTCQYILIESNFPDLEVEVVNIIINSTTYSAPANLFIFQNANIQTWLNGLGLGTFTVSFDVPTKTLLVQSVSNPNVVYSMKFNPQAIGFDDITTRFANNCADLLAILQAIIDYLCNISALNVALAANLQLCYFDYNGNIIYYNYTEASSQSQFNSGVASVICNIVSRINTLAAITCARIISVFTENPLLTFNTSTDKVLGIIGGQCIQMNGQQLGLAVMNSVNAYSDVKALFCAVNCETPATCPDISAINASIVSGNIAIYGVTFASSTSASQTLTVSYRETGSLTWITATNNLGVFANGNVSGVSPYQITGLSVGTTYDLRINNNCGGTGFIMQITTPTSTVYTANFQLDTVLYNICGNATVELYSSSPFASGVTMYSDIGLTTPLTGYTFIANNAGDIYQIDTSTGVVGADTGSDCSSGTAGSYILGNDTGTICSGTPETLYTDGVFAVGGILYSDISLTTPVTGSAYVVNTGNSVIYNLNSITGQIGSSTGLSCTSFSAGYRYGTTEMLLCSGGVTTLWSTAALGTGVTLYTDSGLTTPLTGQNFVSDTTGTEIFNISSVTGVVGVSTGNNC